MSKLDWFTIVVIAVCILAIGALVWNAKNLYQGSKNPADTEISENYNDDNEDYNNDVADIDENDEYDINIDGDGDGDNAVATNGTSSGNGDNINYDTDIAREAAEADAEEARIAEREAAEAAARANSAVSDRINTNTSPSSQNGVSTSGGGSSATASRRAAASSSEGAFMVIIGSYREMISAERMLRSVKAKGYGEARIKKFDNGTYARILVGRRKSLNSARDLQAELISDGFRDVIVMER